MRILSNRCGYDKEYDLEEEDILACIAYGAEMARERYFEYPIEVRQ